MFSEQDYQDAADRLKVDVIWVKAPALVESNGVNFWTIDGVQKPPVRHEAHWFGKLTNYIYNESHPDISCTSWTPSLAAKTWAGAWVQHDKAWALNEEAAAGAASWGPFQVMGFNAARLDYPSAKALKADAFTESGQMNMFVKFVLATPAALDALQRKDAYAFAAAYNGTGAVDDYAPKILNRVAQLS